MNNKLSGKRITSIDAFRGITILVMVFVNELAGIRNIPVWMKHMPADADAMTFVDVVFPAFLFIAGMSIPFALGKRLMNNPDRRKLNEHILWRVAGLLCFGFFMVNGESSGRHDMLFSIYLWSLLFYFFAFMVWQVYRMQNKKRVFILRAAGLAGLLFLALIFRGGQDGHQFMTPKWWGILGLIGWAYLFSCIFYQLSSGKLIPLLFFLLFCTIGFVLTRYYGWNAFHARNATHASVMLCGIIVSILLFDEKKVKTIRLRVLQVLGFAAVLFIAGYFLRPAYAISKVYATPTWGFYSAGTCCVLYLIFYWVIDLKNMVSWTKFFRPAAENPLLTYLIPDVIFMLGMLFHFRLFPAKWAFGLPGMLWSAAFAILVMFIAKGLNKLHIRLQL
jgi:predicted acyltransferase